MTSTTIPKQLYVTIQYRQDAKEDLLGFASPYTKDATFDKRKSTQDNWAYGYGVQVKIDEDDGIELTGKGRQGGYGNMEVDAATIFMSNCAPRIMNNEPREGFTIAKSVRRHGWNGSGNVKWRITDPQGFDLEISSENFARVIDCATLENGVIKGACVWGRTGKDNTLLPVASDVYQSAAVHTERVNTKISLKDVQVGDTVEIIGSRIDQDDCTFVYYGKMHFAFYERNYGYRTNDASDSYILKSIDRYLVQAVSSGKYYAMTSPKVVKIVSKVAAPLDKKTVAKEVMEWLSGANVIDGLGGAMLISPTKFDPAKITVEFIDNDTEHAREHYGEASFCQEGDKIFLAYWRGKYYNHHTSTDPEFDLSQVQLNKNNVNYVTTVVPNPNAGFYYGSRHQTVNIKTATPIEQLKRKRLLVTHGDISNIAWHIN